MLEPPETKKKEQKEKNTPEQSEVRGHEVSTWEGPRRSRVPLGPTLEFRPCLSKVAHLLAELARGTGAVQHPTQSRGVGLTCIGFSRTWSGISPSESVISFGARNLPEG